jgi:hypothetical protein
MLVQVFTVYDSKAKAYLQPFFVPNEEVAKRAIKDIMRDELHNFSQNANDYSLWHIGEFNDQNGLLSPDQVASEVCKLNVFVTPNP